MVELAQLRAGPQGQGSMAPGSQGLGKIGPYQLTREVGRGASGVVYQACTSSGQVVAIKIIAKGSRTRRKRILREATALARLQHPGIVKFHGYHDEGLNICLVMEFLEGEPLCARMRRGPLRLSEALRIGLDVASAMGEVHRLGIIHRDLKPSNIFYSDADGPRARIIDFGLSRRIENPTKVTATGLFVGTPQYASPQQCGGSGEELGPETDVYSLGTILYQLLSGVLPTSGGGNQDIVVQQITCKPRDLGELIPGIEPRLSRTVMRCLEKSPEDRETMESLETVLRDCLLALPADFALPQVREGRPPASNDPTRVKLPLQAPPITEEHPPSAISCIPYLNDKSSATEPSAPAAGSSAASGSRLRLVPSLMAAALASVFVWAAMAALAKVDASDSMTSSPAIEEARAEARPKVEQVQVSPRAAVPVNPPALTIASPQAPVLVNKEAVAQADPPTPLALASQAPTPKAIAKPQQSRQKRSAPVALKQDKRAAKKATSKPVASSGRADSRSPAYADVSVPILY